MQLFGEEICLQKTSTLGHTNSFIWPTKLAKKSFIELQRVIISCDYECDQLQHPPCSDLIVKLNNNQNKTFYNVNYMASDVFTILTKWNTERNRNFNFVWMNFTS